MDEKLPLQIEYSVDNESAKDDKTAQNNVNLALNSQGYSDTIQLDALGPVIINEVSNFI